MIAEIIGGLLILSPVALLALAGNKLRRRSAQIRQDAANERAIHGTKDLSDNDIEHLLEIQP